MFSMLKFGGAVARAAVSNLIEAARRPLYIHAMVTCKVSSGSLIQPSFSPEHGVPR